jgi:hypothetical protein
MLTELNPNINRALGDQSPTVPKGSADVAKISRPNGTLFKLDVYIVLFVHLCVLWCIHYFVHITLLAMTGDPPTPQATWSQYSTEIYLTGKRPIIGSYDYRVVEARAREATKDNPCAFAQSILRIT